MAKHSLLEMLNAIEDNCTFMSSWKDWIILRSLGDYPILGRIAERQSLLTRSKALVRSTNAIFNGCLCFLHFSCIFVTEKIMSIMHLFVRNPDSTPILDIPYSKEPRRSSGSNNVPTMLRRNIPR
jgi:hypothetical protein